MLAAFYASVLPGVGHHALFTLGNKQHTWADSTEQLARKTELLHSQQGVYYATASFEEPTNRTQANVLALRSLRLDIDAGAKKFSAHPDGTYPTQHDALVALVAFSKAASLAPSYIVSSGEGLHVYYCLDADTPPEVWSPLAARLGALCDELGLKADKSVTTDTARVLRPLGTLHPNGSRVAALKATGKVYSVSELTDKLGVPPESDDVFANAPKYDMSVNADVVRSIEGPLKSVVKIVAACGAMREVKNAGGNVPEPYWRAMLGICKFTVEGLDMAHEMSSGYEGYDADATEKKFNAWSTGPTSCSEFSKHTEACVTCPHAGKIKSPVQLGYMNDEQVAQLPVEKQPKEPEPVPAPGMPWDGFLPARFQVTGKPGAYTLQYTMKVVKEDDNGSPVTSNVIVPVTHDIFWLGHWAEAGDSKDLAQVSVHAYSGGRVVSYLMDQSLAAGQFDLLKWLAGKGIHRSTDKKAGQAMSDYVTHQLQRIKALSRRPKISGRFGLRIDDTGDLVCAHGNHVIRGDGTIQEAMLSEELMGHASSFAVPLPPSPTGEWGANVFKDHINPLALEYTEYMNKFYGVPGLEKYQLAAMLGLSSPFMSFVTGSYTEGLELPPNALSVSLYSKGSGLGKTALLQAVMLAFGHPDRLTTVANKAGSTDIGRLERLSVSGTMPTTMDEMGNTSEQSITNMISAVANGKGRVRAGQSGGFASGKSWALINLITTNRSQREMISAGQTDDSPAIQYRLLELDVQGVNFNSTDRDAYLDAWADVQTRTKGALGAVIHRAACQLGHVKLNRALTTAVKKADKFLQAEQGARFQYRALGALIFLHNLLTALRMPLFDLAVLMQEFKNAYNSGADYIVENSLPSDGATLMARMLGELKPHTLITEKETNRAIDRTVFDVALNARMSERIDVRHIVSGGYSYVSVKAVHDWCIENKTSERDMITHCKAHNILVAPRLQEPGQYTQQIDLWKGTREANAARTRAYKVNTRLLCSASGGAWDTGLPGGNVVAMKPAPPPPVPPVDSQLPNTSS